MARQHHLSFYIHWGLAVLFLVAQGDASDKPHEAAVHFNFVSASRIYPTPFSQNPFLKNDSYELGSTFSFAGIYRLSLSDNMKIGVSFEFAPNEFIQYDPNNTKYVDGFRLYLAEISGLFTLPIGNERIHLYVGGGVGTYFGSRKYSIANIESNSLSTAPAFGIHVTSGIEYYIVSSLSIRAEFHFRDPQITVENQFPVKTIISNGVEYEVGTKPFKSKINLNGNVYGVGIAFHF